MVLKYRLSIAEKNSVTDGTSCNGRDNGFSKLMNAFNGFLLAWKYIGGVIHSSVTKYTKYLDQIESWVDTVADQKW